MRSMKKTSASSDSRLSPLRLFWNFLWHDESWASLFTFLIVSVVVIRFVMYPVLGAVLGSSQPVVAVISTSMVHDESFDDWWENSLCKKKFSEYYLYQKEFYSSWNISKENFSAFPFRNGFNKGDVIILKNPSRITIGDVIVADNGGITPYPVIHRVINVSRGGLTTNGDNNKCESWPFEYGIQEGAVIGEAWFRIPYLGWVKVLAVDLITFLFGG